MRVGTSKALLLPAFFVFGGAYAGSGRVFLAHIRAFSCGSISVRAAIMIHLRARIGPDHALPWAMRFRFGLGGKFSRPCRCGGSAAVPRSLTGSLLRRRGSCRLIGRGLRLAARGRLARARTAFDHKCIFGLAGTLNGGFICSPFGLTSSCGFLLSLTCGGKDNYRCCCGDTSEQKSGFGHNVTRLDGLAASMRRPKP
jgi:hypothetical protein